MQSDMIPKIQKSHEARDLIPEWDEDCSTVRWGLNTQVARALIYHIVNKYSEFEYEIVRDNLDSLWRWLTIDSESSKNLLFILEDENVCEFIRKRAIFNKDKLLKVTVSIDEKANVSSKFEPHMLRDSKWNFTLDPLKEFLNTSVSDNRLLEEFMLRKDNPWRYTVEKF
jgi:hypothetical protein